VPRVGSIWFAQPGTFSYFSLASSIYLSIVSHMKNNPLLSRLRYHVTGAIERGEATAIQGQPVTTAQIQDIQTKTTIATYDIEDQAKAADKVKLARRKAEKMNQAYGAIRYVVTFR
jgi:hypothetical protein